MTRLVPTFANLVLLSLASLACSPAPSPSSGKDAGTIEDVDGGSDTDGGPDTDGGADIDGGADVDAGTDPVAPTVVSSSPADGEAGVHENQLLTVYFSEPMDTASVEGAFSSTTLDDVTFAWDTSGSVLSIVPVGGLAMSEGEGLDPSIVDAVAYDFTIDTTATSADGEALEAPYSVAFTTAKRMYANVEAVAELTRTMLANGVVHASDNPTLYVGDSAFAEATQMKTFITIDLAQVPAGVEIEEAALGARQTAINGAPYETLGTIQLEHVRFDAVDQEAFEAPALASLGTFSYNANLVNRAVDVLEVFAADYEDRDALGNVSQYRLSFPEPHDNDPEGDSAEFARDSVKVTITYLAD